ncbi:MAG: FkbM family methyltransferase [Rhodomicrobiaceae bacterium]
MFKRALILLIQKIRFYYLILIGAKEVLLSGIKINVIHPSISKELKKVFFHGGYERDEISILKQHLKNNDIVMEIGAGIGFISSYCASNIGSKRVFAYEANPMMIEKIKQTYLLNNIEPTISNSLLIDQDGEIDFYIEQDFWSSSTIRRSNKAKKISVITKNINTEIKTINPSLLIIDIEGGERDLLPMIDFHNIQKIIIEIHPDIIGLEAASNCIKYILNNGFHLQFEHLRSDVFLFQKNI